MSISRREFLRVGALGLGAIAFTACGGGKNENRSDNGSIIPDTGETSSVGGLGNLKGDEDTRRFIGGAASNPVPGNVEDINDALIYRNQHGVCPPKELVPNGVRISDPKIRGRICPTKDE